VIRIPCTHDALTPIPGQRAAAAAGLPHRRAARGASGKTSTWIVPAQWLKRHASCSRPSRSRLLFADVNVNTWVCGSLMLMRSVASVSCAAEGATAQPSRMVTRKRI